MIESESSDAEENIVVLQQCVQKHCKFVTLKNSDNIVRHYKRTHPDARFTNQDDEKFVITRRVTRFE